MRYAARFRSFMSRRRSANACGSCVIWFQLALARVAGMSREHYVELLENTERPTRIGADRIGCFLVWGHVVAAR